MSRDVKLKTRRVNVQESRGIPALQAVAPLNVRSTNDASVAAEALASAFGLARKIVQRETERADLDAFKQGVTDYQIGEVDRERVSEDLAYAKAVSQLEAKAAWAQDVKDIDDHINSLGLDELTPDELDAVLDEQFMLRYGGLDDEFAAEVLVPRMAEYRERKRKELVEKQQVVVEQNRLANLSIDLKSEVDAALEEQADQLAELIRDGDQVGVETLRANAVRGAINWKAWREQLFALYGGDGSRVNAAMTEVLTRVAIDNGLPELIDAIPDRWENGTPSIRHIPQYADALNTARLKAGRRATEDLTAAMREARDEYIKNVLIPYDTAIAEGSTSETAILNDTRLRESDRRALLINMRATQQRQEREEMHLKAQAAEEFLRSDVINKAFQALLSSRGWEIQDMTFQNPVDGSDITLTRTAVIEGALEVAQKYFSDRYPDSPEKSLNEYARFLDGNNIVDPAWRSRLTGMYNLGTIKNIAERGEVPEELVERVKFIRTIGDDTAFRHVNDERSRTFIEYTLLGIDSGEDVETALVNAAQAMTRPPLEKRRLDNQVEAAISGIDVVDRLRDGWFGVKTEDIPDEDSRMAEDWVRDRTRLLAQTTGRPVDKTLVERAVDEFKRTHVPVKGRIIPVPHDYTPTEWQATMEDALEALVRRYGVGDDDIEVTPLPGDLYLVSTSDGTAVGDYPILSVGQIQRAASVIRNERRAMEDLKLSEEAGKAVERSKNTEKYLKERGTFTANGMRYRYPATL